MKQILSATLLLFGIMFLQSQTFTVEGKVVDFHDKTPLGDSQVRVGDFSTRTDAQGYFNLKNIPKGRYTLVANHPLCVSFTETINVAGDLQITLSLEHHVEELETVILHSAHKKPGSMVVKTISTEAIDRNSSENLGNLLTNISGVGTLKTGNNIAKPIIHGLYGSRISILNNGVKLAEQEWGVEHAPNVEVSNVDHIDVIKGASALRFGGDVVGGVILLEPSVLPKRDSIFGKVSASGISNGRGADVNLSLVKTWKNGWGLKTQGSFKKLGDLDAPEYNLMNTGVQASSFGFGLQKMDYKQGFAFDYYLTQQQIGILRSSHVGSPDDLVRAIQQPEPIFQRQFTYDIDNPHQDVDHHIAKVFAFKRFENLGKISATYSFQMNHRKEYDIRRTAELSEKPAMDLALITNTLNISDLIEREQWTLESGIDAGYQNNYSDPATEARRLVPNYDRYSGGVYSVFKYKLDSDWNFEAAGRFDFTRYDVYKWYNLRDWKDQYASDYPEYEVRVNKNRILTHPILDYKNLAFNAGVEYHPSGKFNLKFNYARIARSPNIAELFADGFHHSAGIIEQGNMHIKSETGDQFNLVAEKRFNVLDGLTLSVNPYLFLTKNFINQVPQGYTNTQWGGTFIIWGYQQIKAKMYGVDLDIDWQLSKNLKYKSRGSYVYGQDKTNNVPLILMLPPNVGNEIEWQHKAWSNFYLNVSQATYLHQTRFPEYNVRIRLFDASGTPYYQDVDISTPPEGYTLWNLQTGVDIAKNFSVNLAIKNLLNTSYRDYLNRLRLFSDEMGRNFILTFKYQF